MLRAPSDLNGPVDLLLNWGFTGSDVALVCHVWLSGRLASFASRIRVVWPANLLEMPSARNDKMNCEFRVLLPA